MLFRSELAAAYAEVGDFKKAIRNQEKAIAFLKDHGKQKAVQRKNLNQDLDLYKKGLPCRDEPVNFGNN